MVLLRAIPCGGGVPSHILGCVFIGGSSILAGCIKNKERKKKQLMREISCLMKGNL